MESRSAIESGAITGRLRTLSADMRLRIMVVDDDDLERELIVDRLRSRGFEAGCAANGQEALVELQRDPYPVVLTDLSMPVMDGIQLTERLRALGMDDTYIIMLTAAEGILQHERGYLAGVDDYLTKRRPETEMLARIYSAFNTFNLRREVKALRATLAANGARLVKPE